MEEIKRLVENLLFENNVDWHEDEDGNSVIKREMDIYWPDIEAAVEAYAQAKVDRATKIPWVD